MKIASFYVLIPLSLNFIFLTCTNMKTEKTIENELQNLFNGIPVHKGIQEIIIDSKHQFRYAKTFSLLVSNENWFTEIEPIEYFPSKTEKIELELNQDSDEKANGCYSASLRLFYENEELMTEEFFRFKEVFEELGEKVDSETEMTEEHDMTGQIVIVYFKKDKKIPNISFIYHRKVNSHENQFMINYQNCLND